MVVSPKVSANMNESTGESSIVSGTGIAGLASEITDAIHDVTGQTGDIVIPVYLGGTILDEVIVNAQQRINLRSGGR